MKILHNAFLFYKFLTLYNKTYTFDDYIEKFHIFIDNNDYIDSLKFTRSNITLGLNEYADVHNDVFKSKYLGLYAKSNNLCKPLDRRLLDSISINDIPENFDWRDKASVISPVKNQKKCGSCWAFACTETAESIYALEHNKLLELSPQELVDCVKTNDGCNGGMIDNTLTYIIEYGLETEKDYPYEAKDDVCRYKRNSGLYKLENCFDVSNNEIDIMKALIIAGPLVACIEADTRLFQLYKSGVITSSHCGTNIDHAIQIVGYGIDKETNIPYWTVRNSWGPTWGEDGYVRIERSIKEHDNTLGTCGIASAVSGFYSSNFNLVKTE